MKNKIRFLSLLLIVCVVAAGLGFLSVFEFGFVPRVHATTAFSTVSVTSVHTCPLDIHTFVVAYHDETNDDFSFQIWDTNGTQILAETDVETNSGGTMSYTSVGVSAFNSTTFVIGWYNKTGLDATFAIYNTAGTLLSGPTIVDTDIGAVGGSVQVSCFNSTHFVIGYYDYTEKDATFAVYEAGNTTAKAGPTDADAAVTSSYSVSVSAFNSTTFVIGWYDDADKDATFAIYSSAGTLLSGPTDADTDVSYSYSVSVSTFNSTHFVIGWFDYSDQDVTFAVYEAGNTTAKTGPIDADTDVSNASFSVQVSALNSTAFVISWYDGVDFDLSFATYLSDGTAVAALTDIEIWPTAANAPFTYQSPCSQESANNIKIYGDNWVIAYANTTTQAIWRAFKPDGTAWDGTTPPPTYSSVAANTTVAGQPSAFSVLWADETNMSGFIFGSNNTGPWINDTWTSTWSNWPTTQSAWANVTKTLNATVGCFVQYEWWANDTSNYWSNTGIQSLTTNAWLTGWSYRKSHVINYAVGAGTLYQKQVTVHYGAGTDGDDDVYLNSHSRTDFGDVRFTDDDGTTLLDYWIESKVDSNNAVFWCEVADSLESAAQTIHVYYGKSDATTASNFDNTFIFGDPFDNAALNTTRWTSVDGSPTYSIDASSHYLEVLDMDVQWWTGVGFHSRTDIAFPATYIVEDAYSFAGMKISHRSDVNISAFGAEFEIRDSDSVVAAGRISDSWTLYANYAKEAFAGAGHWDSGETAGSNGTWYSLLTRIWKLGGNITVELDGTSRVNIANAETSDRVLLEIAKFADAIPGTERVYAFKIRKYVSPEPSHGAWGSEETAPTNLSPTNDGCAITNLDSGKLLAKIRYYVWSVNVSDPNGVSDLVTVDLNFSTGASTYSYGVRWTQGSNVFSVLGTTNGTYFWLGTSSNSTVGTQARLSINVMFGWNYPYTTISAKVNSMDSGSNTNETTFTLNYALIETIQTTAPSPSAIRSNAGGSDSVSGTLEYAGTSTALPDAEIGSVAVHDVGHNSKGTQAGHAAYTVSFTLLSAIVDNPYHVYALGTDANFPSGDLVSSTFNVISDSVTVTIANSVSSKININTNATGISGSAKYDYDGTAYGGSLTWNDTTFTMASATRKYFTVSGISGDSYGITLIRSTNPNSTSVTWDSVTVTISGPPNAEIDINTNATGISGSAKYDYDGAAYSGSLTWNNTSFNYASVQKQAYTVTSVSGDTYGITAIRSINPNSTSEIWNCLNVTSLSGPTYLGSYAYEYFVLLKYGYDGTAVSNGYVGLQNPSGTLALAMLTNSSGYANVTFTPSTYGSFIIYGLNESSYGLTVSAANQSVLICQWAVTPTDVAGNTLSNATINISKSGISWANATAPWQLYVPVDTFNLTVTWLQNLTVNTTLNLGVTGNTYTSLNSTCYPFVTTQRYWVASNSSITSYSYAGSLFTAKLGSPVSNYVLVSSCPTKPTYILNGTYNYASNFSSYLVIDCLGNETFTLSYENWGDLHLPMTDHPLISVSMPGGNLAVNASGTAGDFGHIQIYCGSRGNPYDTGGLTTSYASQTLTGTYTFNDSSMLFVLRWYSGCAPGTPDGVSSYNQPTTLLAQILLSFPSFAQPGTSLPGTLSVTWTGYPTIYLWSVSLDEPYANWTVNIERLPLELQGFIEGNASIPVVIIIPEGAAVGGQQIPCTVTLQTPGGSSKTVRTVVSLELAGIRATVPDVLTYGFVALMLAALVSMPVFIKKRRKTG